MDTIWDPLKLKVVKSESDQTVRPGYLWPMPQLGSLASENGF